MSEEVSARMKYLMEIGGFSTFQEMEEWMNSEKDPALLAELEGNPEEDAYESLYPDGDPEYLMDEN